jgi:hypothetical protein
MKRRGIRMAYITLLWRWYRTSRRSLEQDQEMRGPVVSLHLNISHTHAHFVCCSFQASSQESHQALFKVRKGFEYVQSLTDSGAYYITSNTVLLECDAHCPVTSPRNGLKSLWNLNAPSMLRIRNGALDRVFAKTMVELLVESRLVESCGAGKLDGYGSLRRRVAQE